MQSAIYNAQNAVCRVKSEMDSAQKNPEPSSPNTQPCTPVSPMEIGNMTSVTTAPISVTQCTVKCPPYLHLYLCVYMYIYLYAYIQYLQTKKIIPNTRTKP